jgi:hypothetical protein
VPAVAALAGIAIPAWLGLRPAPEGSAGGRLARMRSGGRLLGEAVRDALGFLRSRDPRLLGAVAWWGFDAAVLWAMLHTFGAPPSLAVVALAYFVGQVGNTIPVPGAVSGGIVGVLLAFGVDSDLAIVSVLAYRAVAIWLPGAVGLSALPALRRTLARWAREIEADAPRPPMTGHIPALRGLDRPQPASHPGPPAPIAVPEAA